MAKHTAFAKAAMAPGVAPGAEAPAALVVGVGELLEVEPAAEPVAEPVAEFELELEVESESAGPIWPPNGAGGDDEPFAAWAALMYASSVWSEEGFTTPTIPPGQ